MKGKVPLGGPATWDREDPDAGLVVTPQLNMIHLEDLYSFKRSIFTLPLLCPGSMADVRKKP